jgi:hypothetical protein
MSLLRAGIRSMGRLGNSTARRERELQRRAARGETLSVADRTWLAKRPIEVEVEERGQEALEDRLAALSDERQAAATDEWLA